MLDPNFGHLGFGDEAERIANFKFVFNLPGDGLADFPTFAIGAEDFIGTQRFNSEYIVMTKDWIDYNIEATLGWGRKRLKGFFGGLAWTPWRKTGYPVLKNLSFLAEYDASDYKNHSHEHPKGRKVSSRVNAGVNYVLSRHPAAEPELPSRTRTFGDGIDPISARIEQGFYS